MGEGVGEGEGEEMGRVWNKPEDTQLRRQNN